MGYTPTTWIDGNPPPIDAQHLQNIENGILAASRHPQIPDAIFYVATDGSDGNSGLSWGDAFLTLARAFVAVAAIGGGKIRMGGGAIQLGNLTVVPRNCDLGGQGRTVTFLVFSSLGNGLSSVAPINSVTLANIRYHDFTLVNTNAANAGGAICDVGGTYVFADRVGFSGWAYHLILDQTEIAHFDKMDFEFPTVAAAWLVNGPDHSPGAAINFTNQITIKRSQFNGQGTPTTAILDDGGAAHAFEDNNYNGFLHHIRLAGTRNAQIRGGEWEQATAESLWLAATTSKGTAGSGQNIKPCLSGAVLSPPVGFGGVKINPSSSYGLSMRDNSAFGQNVPVVTGAANDLFLVADGNSSPQDWLDAIPTSPSFIVAAVGADDHMAVFSGPLNLVRTVAGMPSALASGGAPATYYMRVIEGGTITKIRIRVMNSAGNISLSVHQNANGLFGLAATPGLRVATTGSIACPATGDHDIALPSGVTVAPGDWLALAVDNGTSTFAVGAANGFGDSDMFAGQVGHQGPAFPAPLNPSSFVAGAIFVPVLYGVP